MNLHDDLPALAGMPALPGAVSSPRRTRRYQIAAALPVALAAFLSLSCGSSPGPAASPAQASPARPGTTGNGGANPGGTPNPAGGTGANVSEPEHIQVQHVLVGFSGSVPGKPITRSREDARTLAYDILKKAEGGADFDGLVRQYTDDSPPGIYGMSNRGVRPGPNEFPRDGMVPAFGNVGFALKVGGYGVADYDPRTSPYGYHIIKRLK